MWAARRPEITVGPSTARVSSPQVPDRAARAGPPVPPAIRTIRLRGPASRLHLLFENVARSGAVARPHSVLVVDDERSVRDLFVDVLREAGHRVEVATNGLDALGRLRAGEIPCVVLSDARMPRMDGFELERELRRDPQLSSVPVIVITGDRVLSWSSPARDKPFSSSEIDALVQRSCRLHREPQADVDRHREGSDGDGAELA